MNPLFQPERLAKVDRFGKRRPLRATTPLLLACLSVVTGSVAEAQEWLDTVENALHLQSPSGSARVDLSGVFDVEGYSFDKQPPGLLFADNDFGNGRLSFFLDGRLGHHFYTFVQARVDEGFDPRSEKWGGRFDEYLLRYTPFEDSRLNLQVGKFATVAGNWVKRHDSWSNPFITAPLPYENVTTVADAKVTPTSTSFLARRDQPDNKRAWLPIVWGPSYASGASVFGAIQRLEYALEVKNASLSSRPAVWDARKLTWENPTVTGRVGFAPNATWNFGASFSGGTYLQPAAEELAEFPLHREVDSFWQTTAAVDAAFAWRHWQLWSEVFLTRFDIPNVGDADTLAYYIEAKYKITSQLFAALRWNQQFFNQVQTVAGVLTPWDRDTFRIDAALGLRLNRHWQAKVQYSFTDKDGSIEQGRQLVAGQLTLKF